MSFRGTIPDFQLANPIYTGARVSFYTVNPATGLKTATLATLYAAPTGAATVANPQTLDSEGKFARPIYVDEPVIAEVVSANVGSHSTGPIAPRGRWRGDWTSEARYFTDDFVVDTLTGDILGVTNDHIAGTSVAADLNEDNLEIVLDASAVVAALPAIRHDAAQSLTSGQKLQARSNIGLGIEHSPQFAGLAIVGNAQATRFYSGSSTTARQFELQATGLTGSGAEQTIINQLEAYTPGPGLFYVANGVQNVTTGGNGSREAFQIRQVTRAGSAGEFYVALQGQGRLEYTGAASSGKVFGLGAYAWVDAEISATAEAVGFEANTDVRAAAIIRKVGGQFIDVATSVGRGTAFDAGVLIGKQPGARGYDHAIRFGAVSAGDFNVAFMHAPAGSVPFGIDFSAVTFTDRAIKTPNFSVFPTGRVTVGSMTGSGGAEMLSVRGDADLAASKNNAQIAIQGSAAAAKLFSIGLDTTSDYGLLQVAQDGTGYLPLHLNPLGGAIVASPDGIRLGGATASFPYLKRSGTTLAVRLADDSAAAPITAASFNKVAITAPANAATLTIADGKTLTCNASLTFAGADGTTMTTPGNSTTLAGLGIAQTFSAAQTIALGSIATNLKPLTLSATFNNAGVNFTGLLIDLTNIASGGNSRLFSFKVGGSEMIYANLFGDTVFAGNVLTAAAKGYQFLGRSSMFSPADGQISFRNAADSAYADVYGKDLYSNGTKVVGARDTGWSAMTGTANKNTAYDTASVTLPQLAGRVMSLQAVLATHGLLGA